MSDYNKVSEILEGESDRGAVLIAASMIELALEELLKTKLLDSDTRKDPIFEHNGPLGTFSSKIEMSYRLGLISKEQCLMFNTFRKTRNVFAHSSELLTLEDDKVKDQFTAAIDHNPYIKNKFRDALHEMAEENDYSKDFIDENMKSGRYLLNVIFSLEILALKLAQQKVTKIKRTYG